MVLTIIIIRRTVSQVTSPRLLAPALLVSATLVLAGCSSAGNAATGSSDDLQVVATTTQIADLTRNIIGDTDGVTLTQLIQPNQSAHSYDPSVADLTALGSADVLVINGVGLEEWLDDAIEASGFDGVTVDSDEGITILDDAAGHEGEEHAEEVHVVDGACQQEHSDACGEAADQIERPA